MAKPPFSKARKWLLGLRSATSLVSVLHQRKLYHLFFLFYFYHVMLISGFRLNLAEGRGIKKGKKRRGVIPTMQSNFRFLGARLYGVALQNRNSQTEILQRGVMTRQLCNGTAVRNGTCFLNVIHLRQRIQWGQFFSPWEKNR